MAESIYKITLADGTKLNGLTLNGNNFVSMKPIDKTIFDNNCSPVTITDGTNEEVHQSMELVHLTKMGDEFWFTLRDLTKAELEAIKTRSDIDYIALMCDVDL